MIVVTFPFKPIAKERPRSAPGRPTYTPPRTRRFEEAVAAFWAAKELPTLHGDITVDIVLWKEGFSVAVEEIHPPAGPQLRGDLDNYAKSILDGLERGGAFLNDRQVRTLVIRG